MSAATELSATGPDSKNVTVGQTASFTCTATANPALQDGEVEFRWRVGDDVLDCDNDDCCNLNDISMVNNFESTLELNTMSFPVGLTIDVQCTAYVTSGPDNACTVPEVAGSGFLIVMAGKV